MKLQDGKRYLSRDGNKVTVQRKIEGSYNDYPFIDNNGYTYTEDGLFLNSDEENGKDIIAEVKDEDETWKELSVGDYVYEPGKPRHFKGRILYFKAIIEKDNGEQWFTPVENLRPYRIMTRSEAEAKLGCQIVDE
jgi:hypothetical protein